MKVYNYTQQDIFTAAMLVREPMSIVATKTPSVVFCETDGEFADIELDSGTNWNIMMVNGKSFFNINEKTLYVDKTILNNASMGEILALAYACNHSVDFARGFSRHINNKKESIKRYEERVNELTRAYKYNDTEDFTFHNIELIKQAAINSGVEFGVKDEYFTLRFFNRTFWDDDPENPQSVTYPSVRIYFNYEFNLRKSEFEVGKGVFINKEVGQLLEYCPHPHLTFSSICYGNRENDAKVYIKNKHYEFFMDLLGETLNSYNPDNPYYTFDKVQTSVRVARKYLRDYDKAKWDFVKYVMDMQSHGLRCKYCRRPLVNGECVHPDCPVSVLYHKVCPECTAQMTLKEKMVEGEQTLHIYECLQHQLCPECNEIIYASDNFVCRNNTCSLNPDAHISCACGHQIRPDENKVWFCNNSYCVMHKDSSLHRIFDLEVSNAPDILYIHTRTIFLERTMENYEVLDNFKNKYLMFPDKPVIKVDFINKTIENVGGYIVDDLSAGLRARNDFFMSCYINLLFDRAIFKGMERVIQNTNVQIFQDGISGTFFLGRNEFIFDSKMRLTIEPELIKKHLYDMSQSERTLINTVLDLDKLDKVVESIPSVRPYDGVELDLPNKFIYSKGESYSSSSKRILHNYTSELISAMLNMRESRLAPYIIFYKMDSGIYNWIPITDINEIPDATRYMYDLGTTFMAVQRIQAYKLLEQPFTPQSPKTLNFVCPDCYRVSTNNERSCSNCGYDVKYDKFGNNNE